MGKPTYRMLEGENAELRRLLVRIINGAREVCASDAGAEPWEALTEEIPDADDCARLRLRGVKPWGCGDGARKGE